MQPRLPMRFHDSESDLNHVFLKDYLPQVIRLLRAWC
jgi:hypothetical protein